MKLVGLAPDIQEQLLFLPPTIQGGDRMLGRRLRRVADAMDWARQKELFRCLWNEWERARA